MINKRILLIYTGGTIGMVKDKLKKTLVPFNFDELLKAIPELKSEDVDLDTISIANPIDSSNMNPNHSYPVAYLLVGPLKVSRPKRAVFSMILQ